jgi:hypothetical protein
MVDRSDYAWGLHSYLHLRAIRVVPTRSEGDEPHGTPPKDHRLILVSAVRPGLLYRGDFIVELPQRVKPEAGAPRRHTGTG